MFSTSLDIGNHRRFTTAERPAASSAGYLVLVGGRADQRVRPIDGAVVVGRDPTCGLRLNEADVSRRHARIRPDDEGGLQLEDLGSRNGTRLNGMPVRRASVAMGDRIQFGQRALILVARQDPVDDQLVRLQRLEGLARLAGGVAHDFNNLLGVVMTNLSYLLHLAGDAHLDDPRVAEALRDAAGATRRGIRLTQQLLGFAREGNYERRPVDIGLLVAETARLLRAPAGPRVPVRVACDEGLVVVGDGAQIEQALVNLCLNAVDAVREAKRGSIRITGRRVVVRGSERPELSRVEPGPYAAVTVADSGCGMDAESRARVFEPFFSTKGPDGGSGLGAAMAYGIVRGHGGFVKLESEPGKGTSVTIFLPLKEDRAGHRRTAAPAAEAGRPPDDDPPPAPADEKEAKTR